MRGLALRLLMSTVATPLVPKAASRTPSALSRTTAKSVSVPPVRFCAPVTTSRPSL